MLRSQGMGTSRSLRQKYGECVVVALLGCQKWRTNPDRCTPGLFSCAWASGCQGQRGGSSKDCLISLERAWCGPRPWSTPPHALAHDVIQSTGAWRFIARFHVPSVDESPESSALSLCIFSFPLPLIFFFFFLARGCPVPARLLLAVGPHRNFWPFTECSQLTAFPNARHATLTCWLGI